MEEETRNLDESCKVEKFCFYNSYVRLYIRGALLGVTPESVRKAMHIIERCVTFF